MMAIRSKAGIEKGNDFVQLLEFKGDFLLKNDRLEEAIDCYQDIVETYQKTKGRHSEGSAHASKQLAFTFDRLQRSEDSLFYLAQAIEAYENCGVPNGKFNLIDLYVKKIDLLGVQPVKDQVLDQDILNCYWQVKCLNKDLYGTRDKRTLKA